MVSLQALLRTPHRSYSIRRIDDRTLALFVKVRNEVLRGVAYLQVQSVHGRTEVSDEGITIRDADEVVFYLTAATSFVNYKDVSGDPQAVCEKAIRAIGRRPYPAIRAAHEREYGKYFNSFSIGLGKERRNSPSLELWGLQNESKLPPDFAKECTELIRQLDPTDPIAGAADAPLFQDFRYGRERLSYTFPVQDGGYLLELYFVEPWLGRGGGMNCKGERVFDVAVNDRIVLKDLDIWKEAGLNRALKKTVRVKVSGGRLVLSFPRVGAGQAILSALAVATMKEGLLPAPPSRSLINDLTPKDPSGQSQWRAAAWLDTGQPQYSGDKICFSSLPPKLYGAEWIRGPRVSGQGRKEWDNAGGPRTLDGDTLASFWVSEDADIFIALDR